MKRKNKSELMKFLGFVLAIVIFSCQTQGRKSEDRGAPTHSEAAVQKLDTATFAGGCFWCVEASFEQIKGVQTSFEISTYLPCGFPVQ